MWQAAAAKAGGVEALAARLREGTFVWFGDVGVVGTAHIHTLTGAHLHPTHSATTGYYTELGSDADNDRSPYRAPRPLSAGEWRRVQLARALASPAPPRLLLLDDPALLMSDAEARAFVGRLRRALVRGGEWGSNPPAVVIATQRPVPLAGYADRVAILEGGRVLQYGTPRQVVPSALLPGPSQGQRPGQGSSQQQLQRQQQLQAAFGVAGSVASSPAAASSGGGTGTTGVAPQRQPRARGVRWGGGSTTSNSDSEDEVYLFSREG